MDDHLQAEDADYFDSYSGAEVHRMMLADRVRTEAYRAYGGPAGLKA